MFFGWLIKPQRYPGPPPLPPAVCVLATPAATLFTVTRDGPTLVLCDQGVEVRRMSKQQALNLIARLAMAVRDADGA